MSVVHSFTKTDADANMWRFYRLSVEPGLFGDWALIREWGRIGSTGQTMETWFEDEASAVDACELLALSKRKRGYISSAQH